MYDALFPQPKLHEQITRDEHLLGYGDQTLEHYLQASGAPTHTYEVAGGTITTTLVNSLAPVHMVVRMDQAAYSNFNDDPRTAILSMQREIDEPVAITDELKNGAAKKLQNGHFVPHEKSGYFISNPDAQPAVVIHDEEFLRANGSLNGTFKEPYKPVSVFNERLL